MANTITLARTGVLGTGRVLVTDTNQAVGSRVASLPPHYSVLPHPNFAHLVVIRNDPGALVDVPTDAYLLNWQEVNYAGSTPAISAPASRDAFITSLNTDYFNR